MRQANGLEISRQVQNKDKEAKSKKGLDKTVIKQAVNNGLEQSLTTCLREDLQSVFVSVRYLKI